VAEKILSDSAARYKWSHYLNWSSKIISKADCIEIILLLLSNLESVILKYLSSKTRSKTRFFYFVSIYFDKAWAKNATQRKLNHYKNPIIIA